MTPATEAYIHVRGVISLVTIRLNDANRRELYRLLANDAASRLESLEQIEDPAEVYVPYDKRWRKPANGGGQ